MKNLENIFFGYENDFERKLDFTLCLVGDNINELPEKPGIYCVYIGKRLESKNNEILFQCGMCIYIGESSNVKERALEHQNSRDLLKRLREVKESVREDEVLGYTFAYFDEEEEIRKRVQAALINWHKPKCNKEYMDNFPFPETVIKITGKAKGFLSETVDIEEPGLDIGEPGFSERKY